jgi:DNA segregation ATPase FtsK/SpoIIIE-like protein
MSKAHLHQAYLNQQADRIERALSSMALPAKVQGGRVGERWVRYHLTPVSGTQSHQVTQAADAIADAIGVMEVRVAKEPRGLSVEVPVQQGVELRLLPLLHALPNLAPLTAVVGMMTTGSPLLFNLNRRSTWNLLVTGAGGSGKSELIRSLMISLALTSRRSQVNFLGIDMGGRELAVLEALPHALTDLATEPGFARELILWLGLEIERRLATGIEQPHLVLVIDDLDWLEREQDAEALSALIRIGRQGIAAGVHYLAACRSPLSSTLSELRGARGLVEAGPLEADTSQGELVVGRFQFVAGRDVSEADVAWLSVRDLDSAVRLADAGWRAVGMPALSGVRVSR